MSNVPAIFAPMKPNRRDVCAYLGTALGFMDTKSVDRLAYCYCNSRCARDPQARLILTAWVSCVVEGVLSEPDSNSLTEAVTLLMLQNPPDDWLAESGHSLEAVV